MISGVITIHNVSQFTEFCVLVRLPDYGCPQPKHVAVYRCHVYVFVCAKFKSYKLKKFSRFHFFAEFELPFIFSAC